MPLERVRIDALRCLNDVDCRLDPQRNYIVGPNGAGKTSVLEALYLLGRGRSFRTRETRRLVQHGQDSLSVYAELRSGEQLHRMGVGFGEGVLEVKIDRRRASGSAEMARLLRVDVIDPSVHRLIEGGPSERRRFLDWGVFHVEPTYLEAWRRYRRVLGQRNAALKAGGSPTGMRAWDSALVEAGRGVDRARGEYVERLALLAAEVGGSLAEETVALEYRRGWRSGVELDEALTESWARDSAAGVTRVGPHRADLRVMLRGAPVADEASRGQQKLVAAALVIAQVRLLAETGEREGLLLVDDPAAELDGGGLERLLEEVLALPCQVILTGLSERQLPVESRFPVFHVKQGRVNGCYNTAV